MMHCVKFTTNLVAFLLLLTACSRKADSSPILVSVYDQQLLASDIEGLVPEGLCAEDSVAIVDAYIEQWIRQAVILEKLARMSLITLNANCGNTRTIFLYIPTSVRLLTSFSTPISLMRKLKPIIRSTRVTLPSGTAL